MPPNLSDEPVGEDGLIIGTKLTPADLDSAVVQVQAILTAENEAADAEKP